MPNPESVIVSENRCWLPVCFIPT